MNRFFFSGPISVINGMIYGMVYGALFCTAAWPQVAPVYNDNTKAMTPMWADQGTLAEKTLPDAFEGGKSMVFSYTLPAHWADLAAYSLDWGPSKSFTAARQYQFFSFACKITANNTSADTLSFWCIHCDASKSKDLDFKGKFGFQPTATWQVFSVPMSTWANDPLDIISSVKFNFGGSTGSGDFYFDDVKFSDSPTGIVLDPARQRASSGPFFFRDGGVIKLEINALTGGLISSRWIRLAANEPYAPSRFIDQNLRAGTYFVRQQAVSGQAVGAINNQELIWTGK